MRFWDASGLVPLLVREPSTDAMQALLRRDSAIVVWWGTNLECMSAVVRRQRDGTLSSSGSDVAQRVLTLVAAGWDQVEPSNAIRSSALKLLRIHTLRAADALQLAAALAWGDGTSTGRAFVSLDRRLREAARQEGFAVLPSAGISL